MKRVLFSTANLLLQSRPGFFAAATVGLSLLLPTAVLAQINTATLSGTVTDSSGAVVPNAIVTVTASDSGISRNTKTNGHGYFTVSSLQPGSFSVLITHKGFQSVHQTGVVLQVNQSASLNFALVAGSTSTTVQVSGSIPMLDTQTSSLGTVIGAKEILDLPLNGRQFTQLLQLAPGTVPVDVSQNSGSRPDLGGGGVTPAINGQSNRSDLFFVDGVYATDPFFSGYSISPSIDAIQEFQEQTHADQAEFGGSTGGTINLVTKAGTNHFHGSAYEFIRNDALDASGYFQPQRAGFHQNQFGATVGGPILRNKLFFFGLYDGYRQTQSATNISTLPTAAELNGDFSALLPTTVIYDPHTYNPTTGAITPYANNVIPAAQLNQPLITVLKAYLPATLPATDTPNNYINTASSSLNQDQYGVRIDYAISAKDLLFGRFTINNESQLSPTALPDNSFTTGFNGRNAGINWIHTFSPTLISQITIGYNYLNLPQEDLQPNALGNFTAGGFADGFTPYPGAIKVAKIPGLHPSGYFDLNSGWGPIGPQNTGQFSGTVTKQAGAHSLKFGAAGFINGMYTNWAEDDVNFNQQATWNPTKATGGNSVASMLLGLPDGASRQLGNSGVSLRSRIVGLFAQDSWRVRRNFTLNYGVRWDYTTPVTDTHNRLSGFDIHSGNWYIARGDVNLPTYPLPAGVTVLGRNTITKPDYKNFAPRLGFSYEAVPGTVVRAGAGLFYDSWSGALQAAQNARGAWPSGASQNVSNTNIAGVTPGVTAQNPFGNLSPTLPTTPFPSGGGYLDTNWKDAYSWQWNIQVQQQVGRSSVFSLAYVGSSTSRAPIQTPSNVYTTPGDPSTVPFANMSEFNTLSSIGHMNYNALQSKFDKRFSNGLSATAAFTYSKTINVGCAEYWEGCHIQDPYNLRADRSASDTDVPLVFTFSSVYELPFGKGKSFAQQGLPSKLFGGWQLNGIVSSRSGTPYTVGINFDNAHANGGSQRPNQVGNPNQGKHSVTQYFNTSAFVVPAKLTYGDVRRNSLRGPSYTDLDTSLFRNFSLMNRATVQFRSEFFNVLNHPNFSNPDGTLEDSSFGAIKSIVGNPRQIQFALKVNF